MEEQLVSFETAELAKERGFRLKNCSRYFQNKLYKFTDTKKLQGIAAPTQSLLQKWLRNKHNIDIIIQPLYKTENDIKIGYFYVLFKDDKEINDWQERYGSILDKAHQDIPGNYLNDALYDKYIFEDKFAFKTYEEALEIALQEALKLI